MQHLSATWIVITDSQKAYLFKREKNSEPLLMHELIADLDDVHKKPGRSFDSVGFGRHAIEPHTDPREVEKLRFSNKIADFLNIEFGRNNLDALILIASPKMLGILDKQLGEQVHKKLTHKLSKDIVDMKVSELKEYITAVMNEWKFAS